MGKPKTNGIIRRKQNQVDPSTEKTSIFRTCSDSNEETGDNRKTMRTFAKTSPCFNTLPDTPHQAVFLH